MTVIVTGVPTPPLVVVVCGGVLTLRRGGSNPSWWGFHPFCWSSSSSSPSLPHDRVSFASHPLVSGLVEVRSWAPYVVKIPNSMGSSPTGWTLHLVVGSHSQSWGCIHHYRAVSMAVGPYLLRLGCGSGCPWALGCIRRDWAASLVVHCRCWASTLDLRRCGVRWVVVGLGWIPRCWV